MPSQSVAVTFVLRQKRPAWRRLLLLPGEETKQIAGLLPSPSNKSTTITSTLALGSGDNGGESSGEDKALEEQLRNNPFVRQMAGVGLVAREENQEGKETTQSEVQDDEDDDDDDDDDDEEEDDEEEEEEDDDDDDEDEEDEEMLSQNAEVMQEYEELKSQQRKELDRTLANERGALAAKAKALAEELGLPFVENPAPRGVSSMLRDWEYLVQVGTERIEITRRSFGGEYRQTPVLCDFGSGTIAYRKKFGRDRGSPMLRAVGMTRSDATVRVVDATGGLGKDAFILAHHGCDVTIVERNPAVFAILRDGIERARRDNNDPQTLSRIQLVFGDARNYLSSLPDDQRPHVVYLDPMYPAPAKKRKAMAKAGMVLARSLVGDDADAPELFEVALKRTAGRVVVKRPKWVAEDPLASWQCIGPRTRFEVYDAASVLGLLDKANKAEQQRQAKREQEDEGEEKDKKEEPRKEAIRAALGARA